MGCLPLVSLVRCSASAAGAAFAGCFVRSSSRALSGAVCVSAFSSRAVAAQFARVWAGRLPSRCGCAVRRAGGLFVVSVPVVVWAGCSWGRA